MQNKNALRKILVDIVNECRVLPQCLKIMDVSRERSGNAEGLVSTGGGFADIFLGRYRNVMVALKRLRGITVGADLDKLVVCLTLTIYKKLKLKYVSNMLRRHFLEKPLYGASYTTRTSFHSMALMIRSLSLQER